MLAGFPVVLVNRYLQGIPACSVVTDNRQAASALTAHVLAEGYRKVAFVSPPAEHTSAIEDRLFGFETTVARRGLVPTDRLTLYSSLPTSFTPDNIRADEARIHRFLQTHDGVDAFIASEYNLAVVLADTLVGAGKRVPEDVAVACFDAASQPLQDPCFTHIQQAEEAMGQAAVDLLLRQLAGERISTRHPLDFKLIEGRSTKRAGLQANVTHSEVLRLQASLGTHLE